MQGAGPGGICDPLSIRAETGADDRPPHVLAVDLFLREELVRRLGGGAGGRYLEGLGCGPSSLCLEHFAPGLHVQELLHPVQVDGAILAGREEHLPVPAERRVEKGRLKTAYSPRQQVGVKVGAVRGGIGQADATDDPGSVGLAPEHRVSTDF